MNKGADWTRQWMEPQTRSTAAELFVPLPILMSSALVGSLTAPFFQNPSE